MEHVARLARQVLNLMAKLVRLRNSSLFAVVDDEDFESVNACPWYVMKVNGVPKYAHHMDRDEHGKTISVLMHRYIMQAIPGSWVNHRDRDGFNNQRSNLRVCWPFQTQQNRRRNSNSTWLYKGVRWRSDVGKWRADIQHKGKKINIGYYTSDVQAAMAYDVLARRFFGEFANVNFPDEVDLIHGIY